MQVEGSCHCGNIAFTLDWSPEPTAIAARACTCSFCVKHDGVWTSCPAGSLASMLQQTPASFDGETEPVRLARRVNNWIPRIAFVHADADVAKGD